MRLQGRRDEVSHPAAPTSWYGTRSRLTAPPCARSALRCHRTRSRCRPDLPPVGRPRSRRRHWENNNPYTHDAHSAFTVASHTSHVHRATDARTTAAHHGVSCQSHAGVPMSLVVPPRHAAAIGALVPIGECPRARDGVAGLATAPHDRQHREGRKQLQHCKQHLRACTTHGLGRDNMRAAGTHERGGATSDAPSRRHSD